MDRNLYFMSQIADAFQNPDLQSALETVFRQIMNLGREQEYRRGFLQFLRFIGEVENAPKMPYAWDIRAPLFEKAIDSQHDMGIGFEGLIIMPDIMVHRNGECIFSISTEDLPVIDMIKDALPGFYECRLDTGRVLWEERLTQKELIWTHAFPSQALDLAADTGWAKVRTTRDIILADGQLSIRVFPGMENGLIEIRITG